MKISLTGLLGALVAIVALSPAQAQTAPAQALTLTQAEQLALKNNPHIAVARLLALAQGQITREVRSAEMPTVNANVTAVGSREGSRLTAGGLNSSSLYQRAGAGLALSQLITDFGHTRNLVASANLQAQAANSRENATAAEITLAVDRAFYQALSARAILKVAQETVQTRSTTSEQIGALTNAKLKSSLDLSFANVNLAQAKLLLLDAQNTNQDALATLAALMGEEQAANYTLVDETPSAPAAAPEDADPLAALAFQSRPDLAALNQESDAAKKYSAAQHDLWHPTISAMAVGGGTPVRVDQIPTPWYGAAGVNMSIPVFNGFLNSAKADEATYRARAASEQVRAARDAIARDVRTTVLQAQAGFQRIAVTQQLLDQSNSAFDLSQTRYKMGLSSIVELSQAQLAQTEAQIDYANARYAYQAALATLRYQTGQ